MSEEIIPPEGTILAVPEKPKEPEQSKQSKPEVHIPTALEQAIEKTLIMIEEEKQLEIESHLRTGRTIAEREIAYQEDSIHLTTEREAFELLKKQAEQIIANEEAILIKATNKAKGTMYQADEYFKEAKAKIESTVRAVRGSEFTELLEWIAQVIHGCEDAVINPHMKYTLLPRITELLRKYNRIEVTDGSGYRFKSSI